MTQTTDESALKGALAKVAAEGPPRVAALAAWALERPEELAFGSVRGLAAAAGVNANTVVRLAKALGFDGFEACRGAFQHALRRRGRAYAERAADLRAGADVFEATRRAQEANAAAIFTPPDAALVAECAERLLAARRVHCIGVRSCYAVAHYFGYVGAMAFPNVVQTPAQPGAIMDAVSALGPEDAVIAITFAHYSAEVVRAARIAAGNAVPLIAMTDSLASPIALGAWRTVELPMQGPHFMPSLAPAFVFAELLLAEMAARAPGASARIEEFEARIMAHGGYLGGRG